MTQAVIDHINAMPSVKQPVGTHQEKEPDAQVPVPGKPVVADSSHEALQDGDQGPDDSESSEDDLADL